VELNLVEDDYAGMKRMTTRRWVDWVIVLLGLWLIASPWFLSSDAREQSSVLNVWSVGGGLVALAAFSMYKPTVLGNAIGIMLGAWMIVTPWMLGLANLSSAATNAVIVGILIIGYSLWAMAIDVARQDVTASGPATLNVVRANLR
jgi:hypothetical protein